MSEENKKYTINIDRVVHEDIIHHAYFLGRVNVPAAKRLVDGLYKDIATLYHMPRRCPIYLREDYPPGEYRSLLSCKRYKIIFEILEELSIVKIVNVLDARSGWNIKKSESG